MKCNSNLPKLSKRELDVVRLVSRALTNREIAQRLYLSENTVETHLGHILTKVQGAGFSSVKNRTALAAWFRQVEEDYEAPQDAARQEDFAGCLVRLLSARRLKKEDYARLIRAPLWLVERWLNRSEVPQEAEPTEVPHWLEIIRDRLRLTDEEWRELLDAWRYSVALAAGHDIEPRLGKDLSQKVTSFVWTYMQTCMRTLRVVAVLPKRLFQRNGAAARQPSTWTEVELSNEFMVWVPGELRYFDVNGLVLGCREFGLPPLDSVTLRHDEMDLSGPNIGNFRAALSTPGGGAEVYMEVRDCTQSGTRKRVLSSKGPWALRAAALNLHTELPLLVSGLHGCSTTVVVANLSRTHPTAVRVTFIGPQPDGSQNGAVWHTCRADTLQASASARIDLDSISSLDGFCGRAQIVSEGIDESPPQPLAADAYIFAPNGSTFCVGKETPAGEVAALKEAIHSGLDIPMHDLTSRTTGPVFAFPFPQEAKLFQPRGAKWPVIFRLRDLPAAIGHMLQEDALWCEPFLPRYAVDQFGDHGYRRLVGDYSNRVGVERTNSGYTIKNAGREGWIAVALPPGRILRDFHCKIRATLTTGQEGWAIAFGRRRKGSAGIEYRLTLAPHLKKYGFQRWEPDGAFWKDLVPVTSLDTITENGPNEVTIEQNEQKTNVWINGSHRFCYRVEIPPEGELALILETPGSALECHALEIRTFAFSSGRSDTESRRRFNQALGKAIADLDAVVRHRLNEEVEIVVDHEMPLQPVAGAILGRYEQENSAAGEKSARITLFRRSFELVCHSSSEMEAEIERTLVHEMRHHSGFGEAMVSCLEALERDIALRSRGRGDDH